MSHHFWKLLFWLIGLYILVWIDWRVAAGVFLVDFVPPIIDMIHEWDWSNE